ncbi:MAG: thioesterase family protein [Limnothrix sp.]
MAYSYPRTIHLADTDAAGVVYFSQLLHICHEAYEICLREEGLDWQALLQAGEMAIPIVHAEINFFQPIKWGDRLTIQLYPSAPDPNKLTVQYQIYPDPIPENTTNLLASGQTKHITIQPQQRQRLPLPNIIKKWVKNAPKM